MAVSASSLGIPPTTAPLCLQARAVRPTPPQASCHRRPARRPLRYKSDGATEATTEVPRQQQQVQLSADDVMADMCTMLGGINTE